MINIKYSQFFVLILAFFSFHISNDVPTGYSEEITADMAYEVLKNEIELKDKKVRQKFDLFKVGNFQNIKHRSIEFFNICFLDDVIQSGKVININLKFRKCKFNKLNIKNKKWTGKIEFSDCEFLYLTNLCNNEYAQIAFQNVIFRKEVRFRNCNFKEETKFLQCEFMGLMNNNFSNTTFLKKSFFNCSHIRGSIIFSFSQFQDDVSFIRCHIENNAKFLNVMFMKDVDFGYSNMKNALFGDYQNNENHITIFYGNSDFRNISSTHFLSDGVEFKGNLNFVNAHFGKIASFKNAYLGGDIANFESVSSNGLINFTDAYMPSFQFFWDDIGVSILKSSPKSRLLFFLNNRLEALNRKNDALTVFRHYKNQYMKEKISDPSTSILEKSEIFSGWFILGWTTGYCTMPSRIIIISLISWIFVSIPIVVIKGLLVQMIDNSTFNDDFVHNHQIFKPINIHDLPENSYSCLISINDRLIYGLMYSFALMFKFKFITNIYILQNNKHLFIKNYLFIVRAIGFILIMLTGLTLANTSPIIKNIIGDMIY